MLLNVRCCHIPFVLRAYKNLCCICGGTNREVIPVKYGRELTLTHYTLTLVIALKVMTFVNKNCLIELLLILNLTSYYYEISHYTDQRSLQILRPSSGVCRTREPSLIFELRPLLNPRGSPVLIP